MSMRKVEKYINDNFNQVLYDTREYRAYEMGFAAGYFRLFEYFYKENGEESAFKVFSELLSGDNETNLMKYFRTMVDLYKQENSKAEDFIEKAD